MPTLVTNDGVTLQYSVCGDAASPTVVLVHGWSGSSKYFNLNVNEVSRKGLRVIAYDQRFHGDSDKPDHGLHVSRLAADLLAVLTHLDLQDVTAVGTSMVRLPNMRCSLQSPGTPAQLVAPRLRLCTVVSRCNTMKSIFMVLCRLEYDVTLHFKCLFSGLFCDMELYRAVWPGEVEAGSLCRPGTASGQCTRLAVRLKRLLRRCFPQEASGSAAHRHARFCEGCDPVTSAPCHGP